MSDEHFTVDGTLIEARASQKSFQRKDGGSDGRGRDFRGQVRRNDTHASKTDPDARLYRKSNGAESCLAYLGPLLIENRYGLIAEGRATLADGYGEREAVMLMCAQWERAPGRRRQGLRRGRSCRPDAGAQDDAARRAEPRAARRERHRRPHHRHVGYVKSLHARPRIEPAFGWLKTIAWLRKVKLRGLAKVDWLVVFASAAFNVLRLPKLLPSVA